MEMEKVILIKKGGIATILLNRPEAFNSLDFDTVKQMENAAMDIEEDQGIKVVLVKGKGKSFCTGADLKYFRSIAADRKKIACFINQINRAFNSLENLRVPVIAIVQGHCLAGGCELLISCDLALASTEAIIGDQHANFGLIPGAGGTQRLPRLIGIQRAKELLYTGKWLSGIEAEKYGLILKAVEPTELDNEVEKIARSIVEKSSLGVSYMKKLVNQGMQIDLHNAVELEVAMFLNYFHSDDVQEGLLAFQEKRKPKFK
jgi:enoyl-CoA hydratase/carnithine racemase